MEENCPEANESSVGRASWRNKDMLGNVELGVSNEKEWRVRIKGCDFFYRSLLFKLRWYLLSERSVFWKKVLKAKYTERIVCIIDLGIYTSKSSLLWMDWRGVGLLDNGEAGLVPKSGDWKDCHRGRTLFWLDLWIINTRLKYDIYRLFALSNQQTLLGVWYSGMGGREVVS